MKHLGRRNPDGEHQTMQLRLWGAKGRSFLILNPPAFVSLQIGKEPRIPALEGTMVYTIIATYHFYIVSMTYENTRVEVQSSRHYVRLS
jgi:hypothetical protein